MKISLITPAPLHSRKGNRITANRWARILRELGMEALATPDDRYRFGERLTAEPAPVLRLVGRCIVAQAIIHGAKVPPLR